MTMRVGDYELSVLEATVAAVDFAQTQVRSASAVGLSLLRVHVRASLDVVIKEYGTQRTVEACGQILRAVARRCGVGPDGTAHPTIQALRQERNRLADISATLGGRGHNWGRIWDDFGGSDY